MYVNFGSTNTCISNGLTKGKMSFSWFDALEMDFLYSSWSQSF